MENDSLLIIGLGNPGSKYENTRHNIGFRVLDSFLQEQNSPAGSESPATFNLEKKTRSFIAKLHVAGNNTILAKPQTFMNNSGQAAQDIISFYKVTLDNLLVVHDDIDLPFGNIRFSKGAGSAGHKGVSSIIESLGSKDFARLRIGIGKSANENSEVFVLNKFSSEEEKDISGHLIPKILLAITVYIKDGYEAAVQQCNTK